MIEPTLLERLRWNVLLAAQEHVYAAEKGSDASEEHVSCVCCCIACDSNLSLFEEAMTNAIRAPLLHAIDVEASARQRERHRRLALEARVEELERGK